MIDQSLLDNTVLPTTVPTNPHEIALQSLCKQLLKSRQFTGFYLERRYVEHIKSYRDLICLTKSEKAMDKTLREIRDKLQLFYSRENPQIWIGITSGTSMGMAAAQPAALDTYLWVEVKDLPFGKYTFSIKGIRFRDNEIILKLKVLSVAEEEKEKSGCDKNDEIPENPAENTPNIEQSLQNQVTFDDFMLLFAQWSVSIKQTVYNFLSKDINRESIKDFLRFFGLLIVSIISSAFVGVKFLGAFTIRFMLEFSRLTHVLTPIILKLIDVLSKIIGGFFILLTMVWKDVVGNRNQPKHASLEYNRPMYQSIHQYEERQRRLGSSPTAQPYAQYDIRQSSNFSDNF